MITKQISDKNCSYYEGRGTNSRLLGAQRLVSAPRGPSQVSPSMTPDPNAGPSMMTLSRRPAHQYCLTVLGGGSLSVSTFALTIKEFRSCFLSFLFLRI